MPPTLPQDNYERLIEGLGTAAAGRERQEIHMTGGYTPGTPAYAGDELGTVLVWLWRNDPEGAMRLVVSNLGGLRHEGNDKLADVTLDDVLGGLRHVMPTLSAAEWAEFVDCARLEVPRL